uniref:Uncharacterized protein n=1 Tax=Arundo donax TaxID=35708 RepID=A0A0A9AJP7_ARUDO
MHIKALKESDNFLQLQLSKKDVSS